MIMQRPRMSCDLSFLFVDYESFQICRLFLLPRQSTPTLPALHTSSMSSDWIALARSGRCYAPSSQTTSIPSLATKAANRCFHAGGKSFIVGMEDLESEAIQKGHRARQRHLVRVQEKSQLFENSVFAHFANQHVDIETRRKFGLTEDSTPRMPILADKTYMHSSTSSTALPPRADRDLLGRCRAVIENFIN